MERFIAIIADIKDSKSIKGRESVQEKVGKTLKRINEKYETVIASNFTISSGDSFQGLLKNGNQVMNIILEIDLELCTTTRHFGVRYGIGIGTIDTALYKENSNLVDGEAYHEARNSLNAVKKSESGREKIITNYRVSKKENDLLLINSLLSLVSVIKNKWTEEQVQVIRTYIENNYEQQLTATELGRVQSTISRSLERSSFYSIKDSVDILNTSIEKERVE